MATLTLTYTGTTKGAHHHYTAPVGYKTKVYLPKSVFASAPPSVQLQAEAFAEPVATATADPVKLAERAAKAQASADKAAERARKLLEQVERIKATQPVVVAEPERKAKGKGKAA